MIKPKDWDNTYAATGETYPQLPKGGYVCKVMAAKEEDMPNGGKVLVISFDIAEGDYKDYYKERYQREKANPNILSPKWKGVYRLVEQTKNGGTNPFLKGFITVIENSNKDYKFNFDENTLKDKFFGGVFGYEEFMTDRGVGSSVKCKLALTVEKIRKGEFKIPEDVTIEKNNEKDTNYFVPDNSEEDLPF